MDADTEKSNECLVNSLQRRTITSTAYVLVLRLLLIRPLHVYQYVLRTPAPPITRLRAFLRHYCVLLTDDCYSTRCDTASDAYFMTISSQSSGQSETRLRV